MRYIKLEAKEVPEFGVVAFRFVEQTHRGHDFNEGHDSYTAKNGIILLSANYPMFNKNYNSTTLYVRGEMNGNDAAVLVASIEDFAYIRNAIKEYNEHFADTLEVARPSKPNTFFVE